VDKINKYAEDCARGNAAFTPLVMEAGGRAEKFFKQVVHAVSLQTTMCKSRISTYWKQRLVIASRCTGIRQQRLQALQLNGMNPEFMVELADELGMNDVEDVREGADFRWVQFGCWDGNDKKVCPSEKQNSCRRLSIVVSGQICLYPDKPYEME
jgi:hypothetical protein